MAIFRRSSGANFMVKVSLNSEVVLVVVKQQRDPTCCHINLSLAVLHVRTISLSTKRSMWSRRVLPLLLRLNAYLGLYFTDRLTKGLKLLKLKWFHVVFSSVSIRPGVYCLTDLLTMLLSVNHRLKVNLPYSESPELATQQYTHPI